SSNFILWMRKGVNIRTFDDIRNARAQIVIAGSGSTTANSILPEVLAKYEKLPFKVVRGYPGIIDAILAVERGEADGVFCQRASIRPDMLASGSVVPVFQIFPVDPGLPVLDRFLTDPRERALIELLSAPQRLGLPVVGPPVIPTQLVETLRRSYFRMALSKEYTEEAVKRGFDVGTPNSGQDLADYVATKLTAFPPE